MLIQAFGLFWREDEINWNPGQGNANQFRLLGRRGINNPGLRIADFREQKGVYILYDDYCSCYVGLTEQQTLGARLNQHRNDNLSGKWDRFSWFGFRRVLGQQDGYGIRQLAAMPVAQNMPIADAIADIEALLIKAMGPKNNVANMNFQAAGGPWHQIKLDEVGGYMNRVGN